MKKVTLLLALATLLSMTMNAEVKTYGQMNKKADKVATSTITAVKAIGPKYVTGTKADVPEGYASVTLTAPDIWGDGSGYQMLLDEDAIAYGSIIPETGGLTTGGDASAETYAEFEYKIPENADGALTTTNIVFDASVTILIPAGVYDWCITNPTPGDRMWIASSNGSVPGRYDDFEFSSGVAYEFVIGVYGSNDGVDLIIDDPTAPTIPTDLTADAVSADGTTATIAWVPGENNATWNLRWRPWTDPALMNKLWDFPLDGYEAQLDEGFMIYDADGDGYNWSLAYSSDAQDDVCFYSASYEDYTGLTPDNWLFTPAVGMGGTLKFDAWQASSYYPDKIMVYVAPADYETMDEFVPVSEFIQPTGTSPESFEVDLSEYEGMGVIAFRHYDCNDLWAIYLDNIAVEIPGAVEPAEWTLCENVENPYTIEGLMPETKYEAQVQGVGADARTTNWTESVVFTTEIGEVPVEEGFFLVGDFNDWNQTAEGGRIEFVEDKAENVEFEAGAEFKVITFDENGTVWFGGQDDNNVGYFLINNDLMGVNINTIQGDNGRNFRIEEAGTYNIELAVVRDFDGGVIMTVTKANPDAINTVGVDSKDNAYYNLLGVKFNSMPTTPGIYIHNGKKVIIK